MAGPGFDCCRLPPVVQFCGGSDDLTRIAGAVFIRVCFGGRFNDLKLGERGALIFVVF